MNHLRDDNTVGFNAEQLAALNNWIDRRMEDADTTDPNYLTILDATQKRALDFYQEILGDAGIEYDE